MKRNKIVTALLLVTVLVLTVVLSACGVKMHLNFMINGEVYAQVDFSQDKSIEMPANPTKTGYTFVGWYWDEGTWENPLSLESIRTAPLSAEMYVYAYFKLAHEHHVESWTITVENTCVTDGSRHGLCTDCGEDITETIPATGVHNYENGVCTMCHTNCEHIYVNGVCSVCSLACTHSWKDGVCTICSLHCTHVWNNGVCTTCGFVCQHTTHTGGICTVCGIEIYKIDGDIDFALANKSGKVWVTSLGQAAMSTAEALLRSAGVTYTANNLLEASQVNSGDVVVVVLGASNMGLGNAGTNQAGEIARATAFATKAGIDIVAIHTGQKSIGRGTLADPIIEAIAPYCEAILVVDEDNGIGGNYDDLFTGYAKNNNVPVYLYTATTNMTNSLKALFGK